MGRELQVRVAHLQQQVPVAPPCYATPHPCAIAIQDHNSFNTRAFAVHMCMLVLKTTQP